MAVTVRNMRFWAVMSSSMSFLAVAHGLRTLSSMACDLARLACLAVRPRAALVAENLFLRKQLALFQERQRKPRRADDSTRWLMATLSRWFAWRGALANVKPDTLISSALEVEADGRTPSRN